MFEHDHGGWHIEQTTTDHPEKVRAKVDDLTVWAERVNDEWVLQSVLYARQFWVISNADQRLEVAGMMETKMVAALRRYWAAWLVSPGGVLARIKALEEELEEKAINAGEAPS